LFPWQTVLVFLLFAVAMDTESEFDSDSYFTSDEREGEIEIDDGEEVNATDWHSVDNEAEADRDRIGSFEFLGTPGLNPGIDAADEVENSIPFFLRIFLSEGTFAMLANWTTANAWASVEAVDGEVMAQSQLGNLARL
jgi:hypothetical protein